MILRKGADDSSPCGLKVWVRGGVVLGSIGWCRDPGGVEGTASGSSRGGARPCPPLLPRHRAHLASAEPTPTALQSEQQTEKNSSGFITSLGLWWPSNQSFTQSCQTSILGPCHPIYYISLGFPLMPWSQQCLDWKTKATVKCQKTLTTRLNLVECVSVFRDLEAQVRFLVCAPEILVRVEWFFCQRTQSNLRFLKKKTQNNLPKDFFFMLEMVKVKG